MQEVDLEEEENAENTQETEGAATAGDSKIVLKSTKLAKSKEGKEAASRKRSGGKKRGAKKSNPAGHGKKH